MSDTARFALPLLESGQAQKEMIHNEALARIDIGMQAAVEAIGIDVPPTDPAIGACWVVGVSPGGVWTGAGGAIAGWTAGGWRFLPTHDGMRVWNRATDRMAVRVDGLWEDGVLRGQRLLVDGQQVVGARGSAIAGPVGGNVVDVEGRTAIGRILAALATHGLIAP